MEGSVKVEKYIMADDNRLNYCFVKKEELDNPNKDLKHLQTPQPNFRLVNHCKNISTNYFCFSSQI